MKIISTELQSGASATSVDANYPAANVLTNYIAQKWQAASGNSATLTITINAGGCNTLALFGTNATSCSWTLKDNAGATVATGSEDLTSPNVVNRFWLEFTAQALACSVEMVLTAAVGSVIYAGLVRTGVRSEFTNPDQDSFSENRIDHSIISELSNGAKYIKKRTICRTVSGSMILTRETELRQWLKIYDDNGPEPMAVLPVDGVDDNQFCIFGNQLQPPGVSQYGPLDSNVSFYIEEGV